MPIANYTTYVAELANLLVVPVGDNNYTTVLPNIIDDAEQRIYRELDLLNTVVTQTAALSTATNLFNLPSTVGTFVTVQYVNAITPAGTTSPVAGTRNNLVPVSTEVVNFLYPSSSGSTVPNYFAMLTQTAILVAPWPDQAYTMEIAGTIRPAALSSTNVTTILTQYFPDLFIAASMVFAAAYLKNYGAAVDDPKMAVTWESHYQALMASAAVEEARKKFTGQGWSSKMPAPLATPPRT